MVVIEHWVRTTPSYARSIQDSKGQYNLGKTLWMNAIEERTVRGCFFSKSNFDDWMVGASTGQDGNQRHPLTISMLDNN
jgi:hypothetical protein